ncbi:MULTISPECIES: cupin domain-containing protein [Chromobacterium]|uniref:Cupin domain-containing protein n=1 Tax=Chromobacterium haemolyticum TaxID=394935 RepID=A0ABS3GH60_9NEIS|nr:MULTISPECIES: cupin domain-containing protein [Chromobacterium]MBK0413284.1 cupin domain-containing protein [Chromobacterium haemolyticum]MBO0414386.1 cupin domain-containing protein [Chromobacterium haemolyticum]MBO0497755.1 cupin domain-containing protein [Chromobacterium haemolyticum]WON84605.1 cupin domain-containing protein [Chromobacterium haemolyticum]BBH12699.1 auxin-binding protein [Chromobacterium haemolyticum]
MSKPSHVVNIDQVEAVDYREGDGWGGSYQPLTPALDALPGRLGANLTRLPPGRAGCPFHSHAREDEIFYVLSGRGVLRLGDSLQEIGPGDCISCPAGTGVAHQIANPFDQDLVYLGIGVNDPHEVCVYPDSGKVLVRHLKQVGRLESAPYYDGEPARPGIFDLLERQQVLPRK